MATTGNSAVGLGATAGGQKSDQGAVQGGYPQWEYDLLTKLGAPANTTTLQALRLWAQSEGTSVSQNNPLAVCCTPAGSNGVIAPNGGYPVYSYGSEAAGVNATAQAIQGYPGIVQALRNGSSLYSIFSTINSSKWCAGCQNGHYPVALYNGLTGAEQGGSVGNLAAQLAATSGCNAKGNVFGVLGFNFTYCNLKSITGGLAIAAGAMTMGLGVILIAAFGLTGSRAGRQATALASRAPGPVGRAAKGIRSVGSGRAAPAKVPAPSAVKEPEGAHMARGRHAPGAGIRSTEAVRRHKETVGREQAEEEAFQAKEAKAADRRNLRLVGRTPKGDREDFQRRTA